MLTISPHSASAAAPTVSFDGANLIVIASTYSNLSIGCGAGGAVTVNGSAAVPSVNCADVSYIAARIRKGVTPARNIVDLRGVTAAAYPALAHTMIDSRTGKDTVYGTFATDVIYASGAVSGFAGDDHIAAEDSTTVSVLRGSSGNDTLVSGGNNDRLEGGVGNDILTDLTGGTILALGGDGDDEFRMGGVNSRYEGGKGNDTFLFGVLGLEGMGTGVTMYGGSGADRFTGEFGGVVATVTSGGIGTHLAAAYFGVVNTGSSQGIETYVFDGGTANITMQAAVTIDLQVNSTVVSVPGGVWTQTATGVTAPGLQPVTWPAGATVSIQAA